MRNLADYSLYNMFSLYNAGGLYMGLYFAALLYILIKGDKREKAVFLLTPIFLLLTVFNPLVAPLLMRVFGEAETYYRFFWILPIVILLAYCACKLLLLQKDNKSRFLLGGALLLCIVLSGRFFALSATFREVENPYKVPNELIEIVDILHEDHAHQADGDALMAVVSADFLYDIRSYDPSVHLAFGRDETIGYDTPRDAENMQALSDVFFHNTPIDPELLRHVLLEEEVEYMVVPASFDTLALIESVGSERIATVGDFVVYRAAP